MTFGVSFIFFRKGKRRFSRDDQSAFLYITLICCGIGLFFAILFHIGIKEAKPKNESRGGAEDGDSSHQPPTEVDELEDSSSSSTSSFRWHSWLRIPEFYHVTLLYVCSRLAITLSSAFL